VRVDVYTLTQRISPLISNMAYPQHMPTRYGHCESFFVESHDDGIYVARAEARERQRAIARMQQRALAEELSRLTADEYQEDIMQHMLHMEVSVHAGTPQCYIDQLAVTNHS